MRCIFLAALSAVALCGPAPAHDIWIGNQGLRNAADEWCCGAGDCGVMVSGQVVAVAGGYQVDGLFRLADASAREPYRVVEFIPYAEAQPSPDGAWWRCHRPDGSRRCFFAPPPGS